MSRTTPLDLPWKDDAPTAAPAVPPDRGAPIRPVLFVHGTRSSAEVWRSQLDAVRALGHDASAVDLPGHGTRLGERFSLPGAVHAIDQAVDRLGGVPVVVGLSLGGYAAVAYAARHPGKVSALVLSGCSTQIRGKPLAAYRWLSLQVARTFRPGRHTWDVVADMLASMRGYSPLADLRRLHVPVHLVNGVRDPMRLDERRFLASRPGTRLHLVPRAGHDVHLHAPQAYSRVLLRVLEQVRAEVSPATSHP